MGHRMDLGVALAANRQVAEGIATLESAMEQYAKTPKPSFGLKLIASKTRRELARLLATTRPADSRKRIGEALADVEAYLAARSNNLEMTNDLSGLYEAAGLLDPVYRQKGQQIWRDWPKRGRQSSFDRWRLQQTASQMK